MARTLDVFKEAEQRRAIRLCELAGVNPHGVSADNFVEYRNHFEYDEFIGDIVNGRVQLTLGRDEFALRKRRVARNYLKY